ncbi:LOW QUALITY PROTEIN: exportin-6-like [Tachypleus tridentatus]|uniref:LOW QUALITY PROTEIN: exportin-6-like n=1 Tax=Tachypleus tridentatus TaxID=6853 RepID=UPI003FD613CE
MSSDQSSLRALESLMTEFFSPSTTNGRKREIEELLNNFSYQEGAWRHSLYFMSNTRNEYVIMYCLTMLEQLINKRWVGMLGQDKGEIRSTLYRFLLSHHSSVPPFIRNKLGKLVVDIGRLDWPHFYPDFFTNILQLTQSSETISLGLMLLQTASEELACPREDLSVSRKEELHRLLLEQVPTVLSIITNILDSVLEKHRHLVTATPPPSPTHGQSVDSSQSLFSTSPLHTGSLLSSMFKSLSDKSPFQSLPPLDLESHQLCVQGLNCLAHFLSWIPLSYYITSSLLTTIFHFASFGCDPSLPLPEHMNSDVGTYFPRHTTNKSTLGILAMGCINEIMSKNCVPADFEDFLLQMFQNTFHILQRLTKDIADTTPANVGSAGNNRLSQLDENYIQKFTDFLRLFVSVHLRRFEGNSQFPVLEFLALLFKYTFQQPTLEGFYACLDIWGIFLDYLSTNLKNRHIDSSTVIHRYKEALVSLVTQVLKKIQFRYNQANLEELDDETLDDDSETEWQHFLRQSIETVAKVADLIPDETYSIMYPLFQENIDLYFGLEPYVHLQDGSPSRQLRVTAENECRRLHCALRDLSSIIQAIGRMADQFIGESFWDRFPTASNIVQRLSQVAVYSNKMRFYTVKTPAPSVLKPDFIEVHAQTLAAIKPFCHWLAQYYNDCFQKNELKDEVVSLITRSVESTIPNITEEVPRKVAHSSAHLLMSITFTVRPSFLFSMGTVKDLYSSASQGKLYSLPIETQQLAYRAISNMLLLPWPNVPDNEQEWDSRSTHYQQFIHAVTSPFRQIVESSNFSQDKRAHLQAKPAVKWMIRVLHDLVENITDANTRTKQLCYHSLQETIQHIIPLFPIYLDQPDVSEDILALFLALFGVLRSQMGLPFAEQTIQTFLGLFTSEQLLSGCITHERNAGCRVVEKFLNLLEKVIQEPGSAFKAFIPSTITLCMDQIYPVIAERPSPEVKQALFELLYQLLLNNWKYFFKTSVVDSLGQAGNEVMENKEHFTKIMAAYGQSFLHSDINIFRQNLEALENLHSKWKLYSTGLFRSEMLNQFLNVLLQVLVHKSHDLLQEEIGITIYNMASVDFSNFYHVFLPQFLSSLDGIDNNQKNLLNREFKMDTDLPSFTQSIHRLVNDIRYYRLCNTSLPAGSVQF